MIIAVSRLRRRLEVRQWGSCHQEPNHKTPELMGTILRRGLRLCTRPRCPIYSPSADYCACAIVWNRKGERARRFVCFFASTGADPIYTSRHMQMASLWFSRVVFQKYYFSWASQTRRARLLKCTEVGPWILERSIRRKNPPDMRARK